jgi:hydrogenase nickel incorporation protein HypB
MHKVADIDVQHNIMEANKKLAQKNLKKLEDKGIFSIDMVGAIGSGKTTLIEKIVDQDDFNAGVLAGDVISKFDAKRIESHDVPVVGVNTGRECHLDAHLVDHSIEDLPLDDINLLIIENVGNLICPVDFDLGSHLRIVVVSVTEGDDTVEKHPFIFQTSDIIIINKVDIADAVGADADKMVADAKKINPDAKIIKTSLKNDIGFDEIIEEIKKFQKIYRCFN